MNTINSILAATGATSDVKVIVNGNQVKECKLSADGSTLDIIGRGVDVPLPDLLTLIPAKLEHLDENEQSVILGKVGLRVMTDDERAEFQAKISINSDLD